jgi:uncharacterized iron-regulated membrane protein
MQTHDFSEAGHDVTTLRKSLFWRIHWWAALIATPFALVAVLTGMLYLFTPQIEASLYGHLHRVEPAGRPIRPLDDAVVAAVSASAAGWSVSSVVPPHAANESVKVVMAPDSSAAGHEHDHHGLGVSKPPAQAKPAFGLPRQAVIVYVDPYSAQVLGRMADRDRFGNWARRLHSRWLQTDGWRWMIELAASWLMVMLLTGIYLWWPRAGQRALPQKNAQGRVAWKQWHAFIGVALSVISFTILTTGLTWSQYAGGQIRALRNALHQAPPRIPGGVRSTVVDGAQPLSWQAAWDEARQQVPSVPMQLTAPQQAMDVWRINAFDASQPAKRFDLLLDAYSGRALYYSDWRDQTVFAKATAIGIPFHRGEFGPWNQALLFLFGSGVLFSLLSGWVMFFKRRQKGLPAMPRLLPGAWKSLSVPFWLTSLLLFIAMPLLALSAVFVGLAETIFHVARNRKSDATAFKNLYLNPWL